MDETPDAPPDRVGAASAPEIGAAELYDIGRGQKALLWLMLVLVPLFLLPLPLAVRAYLGLVCAAFAFPLALHLYPPLAAVAMALLCGVPLLGLVFVAFLNVRATRILRRAGIRVGLLGADISQLRAAFAPPTTSA